MAAITPPPTSPADMGGVHQGEGWVLTCWLRSRSRAEKLQLSQQQQQQQPAQQQHSGECCGAARQRRGHRLTRGCRRLLTSSRLVLAGLSLAPASLPRPAPAPRLAPPRCYTRPTQPCPNLLRPAFFPPPICFFIIIYASESHVCRWTGQGRVEGNCRSVGQSARLAGRDETPILASTNHRATSPPPRRSARPMRGGQCMTPAPRHCSAADVTRNTCRTPRHANTRPEHTHKHTHEDLLALNFM